MASILVVEDDDDLRHLVCCLLEMNGHEVRCRRNGLEGLRALDEGFPQVVVSDIEMPQLDGPAMVYRMFVEDVGRENIPVIVVSAGPRLPAIAAELGTRYYLAKPFSAKALLLMIERALAEAVPPRPLGTVGATP
jgi:CheY-like chemotaxis protein